MVTEISTPQNRMTVFAIYAPTFHVGAILGTLLGGQLANPYERLPAFLGGRCELFRKWPYALPSLAIGALCVCSPEASDKEWSLKTPSALLSTTVGMVFLEETRHAEVDRLDEDRPGEEDAKPGVKEGAYAAALRVPSFFFVTAAFTSRFPGSHSCNVLTAPRYPIW
jgi:MFS family permease